jgi:ABC-type Fe3+ transport system permease subunit
MIPTPNFTLADLANNIVSALVPIFAIVVFGMLLWGGFLFITSAGDPQKVIKARNTLTWALIGALIFVVSYTLVLYLGRNILRP